jgi:hypothetical protein
MKKILTKIFITIIVSFILIQFVPRRNNNLSTANSKSIELTHYVPEDVNQILKKSCYDCHSNHTNYPWYSKIQPVSLWLNNHIDEGKDELNFSVFGNYSIRRQFHKLQEIKEQLEENEMPLSSYTIIHREAIITDSQKIAMVLWVEKLRDSFKLVYPADSLKRRAR